MVSDDKKPAAPVAINKISGGIQQNPTPVTNKEHPATRIMTAANQDTRGSPLPTTTRKQMEKSIGADFSNVRVHTGDESQKANNVIGSRAFAQGSNIHFAKGEFNPATKDGQHLLAHELTHTVQQGAAQQKNVEGIKGKPTGENIVPGTKEQTGTDSSSKGKLTEGAKTADKPKAGGKATEGKNKTGDADKTGGGISGGSSKPKPSSAPVKTNVPAPGKTIPKNIGGPPVSGIPVATVDEDHPLSSISNYTPTQIGKGFGVVQQKTSSAVGKKAKDTVNNMPKVPLASGSAYGDPVLKQNKGN